MRLFNGFSPNGARVSIFLAEKGVSLPLTQIDVLKGENLSDAFRARNSLAEVPVLELDDGSFLTESIAICRYLESLYPQPPLFGESALEQARIEMWNRRMELKVFNALADVARHEFEFFSDRGQVAAFAAHRRKDVERIAIWLNTELSDGRDFIAGAAFSVADITGMATLVLAGFAQYEFAPRLQHFQRWADAMRARPSWPRMPA